MKNKSFRNFRVSLWMILLISFLFTSCQKEIKIGTNRIWNINTGKSSCSITLTQKTTGKIIELNGKDKSSAFYYYTKAGKQKLTALNKIITNTDSVYEVSYQTTDKRDAKISIKLRSSGILDIDLAISPAKGIEKTGVFVKANPNERYYGLIERTVDGDQNKSWDPKTKADLSVRGQRIKMLVTPTLGIYEPFFTSSEGYGFFLHGIRQGVFDMASSDESLINVIFDDKKISLSIIPGPGIEDVVKKLPLITGKSFLPPLWAFKPLRWRDEHVNRTKFYDGTPNKAPYNSEVVEDILMAKAYDIPMGAYWVDRPWATGYRGYGDLRWDPVRFPNTQKMIDWINNKNMKFLVWISPWATDSIYDEAKEKGYLMPGFNDIVRNESDKKFWIIDLYNPKAREWWKDILKERLIKMGIAGFKMDRAEEIVKKIDTFSMPDGRKVHDIRNAYSFYYIQTAYKALKEVRGSNDFLAMPRAGYTGSQQYGAFWGGDIAAGEYGLRTALIAVQRCSFLNFPIWGADLGGYWKKPLSHINVSRWLAFGAFLPIMEVGPLNNLAPWNMPYKPHYDTRLIATYRLYSIIHNELAVYSHKMAQKATDTGLPIVRPLSLIYPDDSKAIDRWDEYMYGDNILVGILWKDNQKSFEMYLPEGNWTDYWTGKKYSGNKTLKIDCPDYKIPIFLTGTDRPKLPDPNKIYKESLKLAAKIPNLKKLQDEETW